MDVNTLLDEIAAPASGEEGAIDESLLPEQPKGPSEETLAPEAALEGLTLLRAKLGELSGAIATQQELYAFEAQLMKVDKVDKALAMEIFTMLPSTPIVSRLTMGASRSNRDIALGQARKPLVKVDDIQAIAQSLLDVHYAEFSHREESMRLAKVYSEQVCEVYDRLHKTPPMVLSYGEHVNLLRAPLQSLMGINDEALDYPPYAGKLSRLISAAALHPQLPKWTEFFHAEGVDLAKCASLVKNIAESLHSCQGNLDNRAQQLVRIVSESMEERDLIALGEVMQCALTELEGVKTLRAFLHPQTGIVQALTSLITFLR